MLPVYRNDQMLDAVRFKQGNGFCYWIRMRACGEMLQALRVDRDRCRTVATDENRPEDV
jgi:hypothetical protein